MRGKLLPLLLALLFLLTACAGAGMTDGMGPASPEEPDSPPATAPATAISVPTATPAPTPTPGPTPAATPIPAATLTPTAAPTPAAPPQPAEAASPVCTLSISCAVLLDRPDQLDEGKRELVPESGWLLAPTEVALEEGDSVFDLLLRACRDRGIHMEFSVTPGLGTAYIEGIGNLYEFDWGDLSGWVYAVNGVSPNRGCSDIFPGPGDRVEWCYTCALGDDLPFSRG